MVWGETETREQGGSWYGEGEDEEGGGMVGDVGVWREGVSSSLSPSWFPEADVEPTEPAPISQKPPLSLSGGSAIALIVAASVAGFVLVGSVLFTFIQKLRYLPSLPPIHSASTRHRALSAARLKPSQQPYPREHKVHSERMTWTPDVPHPTSQFPK